MEAGKERKGITCTARFSNFVWRDSASGNQASIVCVSENAGDIIYTYEFEKFRQECGLSIRMCRGADPESKGKIENVVKYIKGNFLSHRLYVDNGMRGG